MRFFFIKICVVFSILIGSTAFINFTIDPAGMYIELSSIEESIAQYLNKNKNIAFQSRNFYDERKLKTILASMADKNNYDCVIVGSSTSRYLNGNSSNFKNCLNLSIQGGDLDENFALLSIALDRVNVMSVVINMDISIFSKKNWSPKNRKYPALMFEKLKKINEYGLEAQSSSSPFNFDKIAKTTNYYLELINGHYLVASLNKVFLLIISNNNFQLCGDVLAYVECINSDGSSSLDNRIIRSVTESHTFSLPSYLNDNGFQFSESKLVLMESFLEELTRKGIAITFYIPPTRPDLYNEITKTKWYGKNNEIIKNLVEKYNIKTSGSHDPSVFGCVMQDFDDDVHVNVNCIKKIWNIKSPSL
jgi:hypothetical protein